MLGALLLTLPVATIDRETLVLWMLLLPPPRRCALPADGGEHRVTFSLFGQVVIILLTRWAVWAS